MYFDFLKLSLTFFLGFLNHERNSAIVPRVYSIVPVKEKPINIPKAPPTEPRIFIPEIIRYSSCTILNGFIILSPFKAFGRENVYSNGKVDFLV